MPMTVEQVKQECKELIDAFTRRNVALAGELAFRDKRIAELESELDRVATATTVQRCNGCEEEHWARPRDMAGGRCAKWWRDKAQELALALQFAGRHHPINEIWLNSVLADPAVTALLEE